MAQIVTKRIEHNGVSYDVPIYEPNDVPYPFRRVYVNGQYGAYPYFPLSDNPAYDFRRVYHDGQVWGLHDQNDLYVEVDAGSAYSGAIYVDNGTLYTDSSLNTPLTLSSTSEGVGGFDTVLDPDGTPSTATGYLEYENHELAINGTRGYKITNGTYRLSKIKNPPDNYGDFEVNGGDLTLEYQKTTSSSYWVSRSNTLLIVRNDGESKGKAWTPPTGYDYKNFKLQITVYGSGSGSDITVNVYGVVDLDRNGIGDKTFSATNNDGALDKTYGSTSISESALSNNGIYVTLNAGNPAISNGSFDRAVLTGKYSERHTSSSTSTYHSDVVLTP